MGGFDTWIQLLSKYASENKHANVPQTYVADGGERLGAWVCKQRNKYKTNKLSQEHIKQLEALPGWEWDSQAAAWKTHYRELKQFTSLHNRIPAEREPGFEKLGSWCRKQRKHGREGLLTDTRYALLSNVEGWKWDAKQVAEPKPVRPYPLPNELKNSFIVDIRPADTTTETPPSGIVTIAKNATLSQLVAKIALFAENVEAVHNWNVLTSPRNKNDVRRVPPMLPSSEIPKEWEGYGYFANLEEIDGEIVVVEEAFSNPLTNQVFRHKDEARVMLVVPHPETGELVAGWMRITFFNGNSNNDYIRNLRHQLRALENSSTK